MTKQKVTLKQFTLDYPRIGQYLTPFYTPEMAVSFAATHTEWFSAYNALVATGDSPHTADNDPKLFFQAVADL